MKPLNSIAVFDNDECFIALLKGYCYANNITMTEFDFNSDGFNELEKIKPSLIVVPLDLVSTHLETGLLRQACASCEVKICGVKKNSTDNFSAGLAGGVDIIINNPFDIGEIDRYLKQNFLLNSHLTEKRRNMEKIGRAHV